MERVDCDISVVFSDFLPARWPFAWDNRGLIVNGPWWAAASHGERRAAINRLVGEGEGGGGQMYGGCSQARMSYPPNPLSRRVADVTRAAWERLIMTDPPAP